MNFQITVLKVLAGHPDGKASLADLKHFVSVLANSGPDWSQRMKRLSARAPGLDIFSSGYVLRDTTGWQITDAGRAFLTSIEAPAAEPVLVEPAPVEPKVQGPIAAPAPDHPSNVVPLERRRRRAAA